MPKKSETITIEAREQSLALQFVTTQPTTAIDGTAWFNPATNRLRISSGGAWKEVQLS